MSSLAHPHPGQSFKGVKSFIGTPEMERTFVVKDTLFCSMKKMHGLHGNHGNIILKHWGVHAKMAISPLLLILDH